MGDKPKELTLKEKQKLVTKGYEELREKYNLDLDIKLEFPDYRNLPADLQLALMVLSKHRISYIITYTEKKEVNK